jgi:hypothetical protein
MRTRLSIALLLIWSAACAYVPVDVESDASSVSGKTWAWLPRSPVGHGEAEFALIDERVRADVERDLAARRFKKVDKERPDYLVTYYAALDKPISAQAITYAAGVPLMAKAVTSYPQGSLVIDLLDAKTGKLVWRGVGRRVFDAKQTPDERKERIDAAVESVVDEFAPS